jgi:hypothetical protein
MTMIMALIVPAGPSCPAGVGDYQNTHLRFEGGQGLSYLGDGFLVPNRHQHWSRLVATEEHHMAPGILEHLVGKRCQIARSGAGAEIGY